MRRVERDPHTDTQNAHISHPKQLLPTEKLLTQSLMLCVLCVYAMWESNRAFLLFLANSKDMPGVELDVVVPPGIGPGDAVEFAGPDGATLQAIVPDGLAEGDVFKVTVEGGTVSILKELGMAMQGGDGIMDMFVAWFEKEQVGARIDQFIKDNAKRIGVLEFGGAQDGEHNHDWWPLYCEYQAQFEALLQGFLDEAGCTAEEFFAEAKRAEGMSEFAVSLFLAHSEYEMFVEQMSQAAVEQAAAAEED